MQSCRNPYPIMTLPLLPRTLSRSRFRFRLNTQHPIAHTSSHTQASSTVQPSSTIRPTHAGKMTSYRALVPSASSPPSVPESVVSFFEKFYGTSDDGSEAGHAAYAASFTGDATLVMGTTRARGREEIAALRRALWSGPVVARRHAVDKIFPWNSPADELMLFGRVTYRLVNGKHVLVEWAARAELVLEDAGAVKMKFYQVYLDSAPVVNAMKD